MYALIRKQNVFYSKLRTNAIQQPMKVLINQQMFTNWKSDTYGRVPVSDLRGFEFEILMAFTGVGIHCRQHSKLGYN